MKCLMRILLPLSLVATPLAAEQTSCIEAALSEMNAYYHTGAGCEDEIFNGVSASMLGWGFGLFAGIALLTGLIHNSRESSQSSLDHSNSREINFRNEVD